MALLASISVNAIALTSPESKSVSYAAQSLDFGIDTTNFEAKSLTYYLNQDEANKNAALAGIKAIRSEMWDQNVPYTYDSKEKKENTKLRDYLKSKGINSKEEYINRVQWSNDLEKIAIQRMYEVSVTGLTHTRPDGSHSSDAKLPSDTTSYGEIIANNTQSLTPQKAFNQWTHSKRSKYGGKSEYELLVESNGVYNNGNGHLHIILDPEYDHIGMSIINVNGLNYAGVEFGYADDSGNKATGLVGEYTMTFGKKAQASGELDEETKQALKDTIKQSKLTIGGVKQLYDTAPEKVAHVRDKLDKLIEESEALIKEAEELLASA